MANHERLDCMKCPSLCCRMAGYVRVSRDDIRRLAKHLKITTGEFERRHILEITKKGEKRIKEGFKTCQFLTEDRMCGVYDARPHDCRGYVCWNQEDETVYDYAVFLQDKVPALREREKDLKKDQNSSRQNLHEAVVAVSAAQAALSAAMIRLAETKSSPAPEECAADVLERV